METLIQQAISTETGLYTLPIRVGAGAIFAAHGAQKLFGWFGGYGLEGTAGWMGAGSYSADRALVNRLA